VIRPPSETPAAKVNCYLLFMLFVICSFFIVHWKVENEQ